MAVKKPRPWAVKVLVALLGGVLLAVLSVPAAAYVSQRWGAFSGGNTAPTFATYVRLHDGTVHIVSERWTKPGYAGPPRLMRHRGTSRVRPGDESYRARVQASDPPGPDPRPGFLRRPPPRGFNRVQAYSSGWPWHAGYSRSFDDHAHGPVARETYGEASIRVGGYDYVMPYLPHWPGLLANTAFYASLVFVPWAGLRLARSARRRRRGGCARCGYPLDDGMKRCPECGAAALIARTAPASELLEAE